MLIPKISLTLTLIAVGMASCYTPAVATESVINEKYRIIADANTQPVVKNEPRCMLLTVATQQQKIHGWVLTLQDGDKQRWTNTVSAGRFLRGHNIHVELRDMDSHPAKRKSCIIGQQRPEVGS